MVNRYHTGVLGGTCDWVPGPLTRRPVAIPLARFPTMKSLLPIPLTGLIATALGGLVTDRLAVLGEKMFAFKDEPSSKSR